MRQGLKQSQVKHAHGSNAVRPVHPPATLQAIRFGEFLCERDLIDEEQLLDALGAHWAGGGRIGHVIVERGYMSAEAVEKQAGVYHGLDVIEV